MITISRFFASIILFILLAFMESRDPGWIYPLVCMVLFILVVATDALDGYLARKYKQVTDFGRIADPVADKILICGTLIFICASAWGAPYLPAWFVVVIVAREFLVTGMRGFIEARGHSFAASWSGKLKMMFQSILIPALFFRQIIASAFPEHSWMETSVRYLVYGLLVVVLILTVNSGVLYTVRAAKVLGSKGE
jgi:CDP-diacylglycerol--glycerol-3-phosphate 3-phosphatidyltransferase